MFGWAFIGSGAIAHTVAREIQKTGRHRVVSVYSRTESKCVKFANTISATPCKTFEEAVTHEGVDGVYLATPHSCHFHEIMECIRLGIPVLSEKAFTINSQQIETIIEARRESYVSEGMWTRYNPITIEVRRLISEGVLGNIESIDASFCYPYLLSGFSDRVVKREAGGGALLDIGVYPISYAHMLLGSPDSIESTMKMGKYDTDIYDDIHMRYGDTRVHIRCGLDRLSTCSATIKGTLGSIHIPLFYRPTHAVVRVGNSRQRLVASAGYIHEFDAVSREILEGKLESDYITLADSLSVMRTLDEIRHAHSLHYSEEIEDSVF